MNVFLLEKTALLSALAWWYKVCNLALKNVNTPKIWKSSRRLRKKSFSPIYLPRRLPLPLVKTTRTPINFFLETDPAAFCWQTSSILTHLAGYLLSMNTKWRFKALFGTSIPLTKRGCSSGKNWLTRCWICSKKDGQKGPITSNWEKHIYGFCK